MSLWPKQRKGAGRDKPLVSGRTLARLVKPLPRRGCGGPWFKKARVYRSESDVRVEELPCGCPNTNYHPES